MKQRELSIWLRAVVMLGAACVLVLALWVVPDIGRDFGLGAPELAHLYWPCLIAVWLSAVPVFIFMALVWQMAVEIGRDNSFCLANARRLRSCSFLAALDTLLYVAGALVLSLLNALHVGALLLIALLAAVGAAVAVCCAALSHLTRKAAEMKSENDLTV